MSGHMTHPTSRPAAFERAARFAVCAIPLLLPVTAAVAQVHTCTVEGVKVFQDRPCKPAPGPTPSAAAPTAPPSPRERPPMGDPAYEAQRDAERLKAIKAYGERAGRALGAQMDQISRECGPAGQAAPYIGATLDWVARCSTWGKPNRTLTTTTAQGETQMWAYDMRGYLYFDASGRLRTIQTR